MARILVPDLYILTDARGFVTAIRGAPSIELARIPLLVPIQVDSWTIHGRHDYMTWRRHSSYVWDGMVASWR